MYFVNEETRCCVHKLSDLKIQAPILTAQSCFLSYLPTTRTTHTVLSNEPQFGGSLHWPSKGQRSFGKGSRVQTPLFPHPPADIMSAVDDTLALIAANTDNKCNARPKHVNVKVHYQVCRRNMHKIFQHSLQVFVEHIVL